MGSNLYSFDDSFFSEPFSTAIDDLQAFPVDEHNNSFDQIAPLLFSSSPPSHQLENLSLYQTAHLPNSSYSNTQFPDFTDLEVKTEDFNSINNNFQSFEAQESYGGNENAMKMMQRSYSSNCFEGKPDFLFQPRFDSVMEFPNFNLKVMSSPENSFSVGEMRRVCSTGDLQNQKIKTTETTHKLSSSPLATESSLMEEANFKVGRYTAEERKERIHKYRAKRTQRNFSKTIKYACRKTLADNRLRIRGRFARNDEPGDQIPKASVFNQYEDEDDLWIDGFNEEDDGAGRLGGPFFNSYGSTHFQYYGLS